MSEWPNEVIPNSMSWNIVSNNFAFTSPFNNSQQVVGHPGGYWECSIDLPLLDQQQARLMSSFIHSLHGMMGTFRLYPWNRRPGPAAGNGVVDLGGQAGGQLVTRGWNAGTTVLRRGDYITVSDQLLEVLQDVVSNDQGRATILVAPWLRVPPANGAAVNYRNPYAVMRLTEDGANTDYQGIIASASLSCREAF
ncbi:hypothetical protein [Vreelandella populi]|uniref:hypothetical protein n=1 Tax=Vreelandella populi TaxID=2498858 RepID=UPI000F8E666D|nr:hypothetical protein [Halomonas populi]RUR38565.1 hypothetical protein ELY25_09385 [Halomonas populi]